MKDDRFLFCTKGTSAIGEFNMHKKLFWRDFSINPDDTYVISTQSIWTSRQRSHIQGDKNIPAKFPGWSITIRKCYEFCLETDTMSRVRGACFLWDSVLSSSPDPGKVSLQSTFFPLLVFWAYYRFARVWVLINPLIKRDEWLNECIYTEKIQTADIEIRTFS